MQFKRMNPKVISIIALTIILGACSNPADNKPAAEVSEAQGVTEESSTVPAPVANGTIYVIAPESTVGFIGSKVTGSHHGGFRSFQGKIELVDSDPVKSKVMVTISTNSIFADNDRLTGHLKSADFFDVEKFPAAVFISNAITKQPDGSYEIGGDFQLHGVSKYISFPAQIEIAEGAVHAKAEFVIKRFDFGIVYPGKADDLIRDEVVIQLDLTAKPQTENT